MLYCYLGMVLHANKNPAAALEMLETALKIDPSQTLAKFKRAIVLASLERYEVLDFEFQFIYFTKKSGSLVGVPYA